MTSVLFVCMGNICRSTMAEAVLRHMVELQGLSERILVDSAGTAGYHIGEPPHSGTRRKLREMGISDAGIRARKVTGADLDRFDCVVAMDEENLRDLRRLASPQNRDRLRLLADYVEGGAFPVGRGVPDPWYTGDFEETYRLVEQGCRALLAHILARG